MPATVTHQLIAEHLVEGDLTPGSEIALAIDQTLTQDATGTLVMLELEALGLDVARTDVSAQYVDHNLVQQDSKNQDDHLFLRSACRRFGLWYSPAGNGVSHAVHMERLGRPGATLLGADSHTCAGGSLGMLAIGAGGLDVAMAIAGEPFHLTMPEIWGVRLDGQLGPWVSAKDVILEMLRRHGVAGGVGSIIEYYGPGVQSLSAMDRHVIANMGAELGATSSVFPADDAVAAFLTAQGRDDQFRSLIAQVGASYDRTDQIDLASVVPLIALPTSPGNVVPVSEVAGAEIAQSYIGSSANPGYRDFAIAAEIVAGRRISDRVSFDINPTSRQVLENLMADGHLASLVHAGARLHQAGCNGCIGMGQAPATDRISLRTVPRNFPGRSGAREDRVHLVSPETAAASALHGVITDPRELDMDDPTVAEPAQPILAEDMLIPPLPERERSAVELEKGPNIVSLPEFEPLADELLVSVLLTLGDDISTDEIMPAGARVLPFRSNIEAISQFVFDVIDDTYHDEAIRCRDDGGHAIVAGRNYGQGSSREHAAVAPRYLGLRVVIADGFARIHRQNLPNFGILPLTFASPHDRARFERGDRLRFVGLRTQLGDPARRILVTHERDDGEHELELRHDLTEREIEHALAGGRINHLQVGS